MDKRTRAKLNIKVAQAQNATSWWETEGYPGLSADTAPADPASKVMSNTSPKDNPNNVSSNLFSSMDNAIDPEVQNNVITLINIIKELSLKFYNLTLSDTEALKIAKENLKDISSRISHIPVEQLTDMIDEHINKIDKGVTNNQKTEGGETKADATMPVENPSEPAGAQEAAPPAPEEQGNAPEANYNKMASKQALFGYNKYKPKEFDRESQNDLSDSVEPIWDALQDSANDHKLLSTGVDVINSEYNGETPPLKLIEDLMKDRQVRLSGASAIFANVLKERGLPYRWIQVGSEEEYVPNLNDEEPLPEDIESSMMKDYYKKPHGDTRLASLYREKQSSINKHFNVESLQQFLNVVKFNRSNFEYFLKNNTNDSKKNTPW